MAEVWYYLDLFNQPSGPYDAQAIKRMTMRGDLYVWREGLDNWALATSLPEFQRPAPQLDQDGQPVNLGFNYQQNIHKALDELSGICKGLLIDGKLSDEEINFLADWLAQHTNVLNDFPASIIAKRVFEILQDGIVTKEEAEDLQSILLKAIGGQPSPHAAVSYATRLPIDAPAPELVFAERSFCFTGKFLYGGRKACEQITSSLQGTTEASVKRSLNYLVIGTLASRDWLHTNHGRKIEAALLNKEKGHNTVIVAEEHWIKHLP